MSIALKEIAGLTELLQSTREVETATREDAWLGITHVIAGQRIRVMTIQDYTALLQFESPLLNRRLPTPSELSFFLWVLSPEIEKWHEGRGWRSSAFLKWIEQRKSRQHGQRVREALQLADLEKQEAAWHAKAPGIPFTLEDDLPFTIAVKDAFKYIDQMFMDRPAALKKEGAKSGLCYLTSWFDMLQSEYHLPTKEIWRMKLPVLFARIKAIQNRYSKGVPDFNVDRDKVLQNIMQGLRMKLYTEEDLRSGRVDLVKNCLRNN